ncbi:MAG TPA: Fe-Mn family superoxide dismutase [Candidatus Binatia bacterium]|nr:Fe-Mn family superoxide dismutase [Candidatus Binatia bacterium]
MPEVKPLKYKSLPGFSEKMLSEHHDVLYAGYCKKVDEIRQKLQNVDLSTANATYSDLRELKLEETFAVNGVRMHETYFDNLGGKGGKASGHVLKLIEQDFGSYEKWEAQFKAMGLCTRGWVVLAFDWLEMKLHNYLCDAHNHGGIWNCTPLLILDMYEHAFFLDYGTTKKQYVESFFKNIDWAHSNVLIKNLGIDKGRKL